MNGANTVNVVYSGGTATYGVTFRQNGECLGGTLTDNNIPNGPKTGPIFGRVNRSTITFSFTYTYAGAAQGTRTFTGTISRFGAVSGTWNETGTEGLTGTWSLAAKADRACPGARCGGSSGAGATSTAKGKTASARDEPARTRRAARQPHRGSGAAGVFSRHAADQAYLAPP